MPEEITKIKKSKAAPSSRSLKIVHCDSVEQFQTELSKHQHRHGLAWRGQACSDWSLESSLLRQVRSRAHYRDYSYQDLALDVSYTVSHHVSEIQSLFAEHSEFRMIFADLIKDPLIERHPEFNELWHFAQHHGMVTPLLDVTQSPYYALAFALYDRLQMQSASCCPISVWMIPANLWNLSDEPVHKDGLTIIDHQRTFKIDEPEKKDLPVEVKISNFYPRRYRSPRLAAQLASFIKVEPEMPLDLAAQHIRLPDGWLIDKFTRFDLAANPENLIDVLQYLNHVGIRQRVLFPEPLGVMRDLNLSIKYPEAFGRADFLQDTILDHP